MNTIKLGLIAACATLTIWNNAANAQTTFTDAVPHVGCYKENGSDLCVDTTLINCVDIYEKPLTQVQRYKRLQDNVRKWGSVIASMCDDMQWTTERQVHFETENVRLKQRLAEYKTLLRKYKR